MKKLKLAQLFCCKWHEVANIFAMGYYVYGMIAKKYKYDKYGLFEPLLLLFKVKHQKSLRMDHPAVHNNRLLAV